MADAAEYAITNGCCSEGEGPKSSTIEGSSNKGAPVSLVRLNWGFGAGGGGGDEDNCRAAAVVLFAVA